MSVMADLERFVAAHRKCGALIGDATAPTPGGYLLWIICSCGARFDHWVTPETAEADLVYSRLPASPN